MDFASLCDRGIKINPYTESHRVRYIVQFLNSSAGLASQTTVDGVGLVELEDGPTLSMAFTSRMAKLRVAVLTPSAPLNHLNSIMLMPDVYFIRSHGYDKMTGKIRAISRRTPFRRKRFAVTFRGASTGPVPSFEDFPGQNTRIKLCLHARELDRKASKPSSMSAVRSVFARAMDGYKTTGIWDVGISTIVQVDHAMTIKLKQEDLLRAKKKPQEMIGDRGIFDVDGNSNSWNGLWWKLLSNSVVLKVQSPWQQWYYRYLIPWVHYIPVAADLADVDSQVAYVLDSKHNSNLSAIAEASTKLMKSMTHEKAMSFHRAKLVECFANARCGEVETAPSQQMKYTTPHKAP